MLSFKKFFSRSEWVIRILGLSRKDPAGPGLLMVQIDGLPMRQINRALGKGKMPFLKSLIEKDSYVLHRHYSGLPSATQAVQGEIFYGLKAFVPNFHYLDRRTRRIFTLYDHESAREIESRLKEKGQGLLEGGSSYVNLYTGGAEEAHICAAKWGLSGFLHAIKPWIFPLLMLCYLDIFLRTMILLIVEFFLAIIDSIRGTLKGKIFAKEFEFIFIRVVTCIVFREFAVEGAKVDLARGLPIIHLNLIGYDEQAHRRGPSSTFAHESLSGIDDAIRRIWRKTKNVPKHYDLWVYSDHGQEKTNSYALVHKQTLEAAVKKVLDGEISPQKTFSTIGDEAVSKERFMREKMTQRAHLKINGSKHDPKNKIVAEDELAIVAMGPVGNIYLPYSIDAATTERIAAKLVSEANIPLVLLGANSPDQRAWTPKGCFKIPEDLGQIVGENHPFIKEFAVDLEALRAHPDTGEFILFGWSHGEIPISFTIENGEHGGLGEDETTGFALLPVDAPLKPRAVDHLRPMDIREAAFRFLGKLDNIKTPAKPKVEHTTLRIMTYNVHGCVGTDGRLSVDRIARVISRQNVDLVALQELDCQRGRSGGIHQAEAIARKLEMHFHFHAAYRLTDGEYGNAILSRYPIALVKSGMLPRLAERREFEPRGALWVSLELDGRPVQIITTHLSLWPAERFYQTSALLGEQWLGHADCRTPTILCGDLNALPDSVIYKRFCGRLNDCQRQLKGHKPKKTMGQYPFRVDHILVGEHFEINHVVVPSTTLDRDASDHLPLVAELKLK